MRLVILGISSVAILLASPAMANDWVDAINIFVRPQGSGVTVSGRGNDVYVNVLNNDRFQKPYVVIGGRVSTRKWETPRSAKKRTPRVSIGIGN